MLPSSQNLSLSEVVHANPFASGVVAQKIRSVSGITPTMAVSDFHGKELYCEEVIDMLLIYH